MVKKVPDKGKPILATMQESSYVPSEVSAIPAGVWRLQSEVGALVVRQPAPESERCIHD